MPALLLSCNTCVAQQPSTVVVELPDLPGSPDYCFGPAYGSRRAKAGILRRRQEPAFNKRRAKPAEFFLTRAALDTTVDAPVAPVVAIPALLARRRLKTFQ